MSVETATYIGDFNAAWPQNIDLRSEGAAHIRLIKQVLQNCFPGLEAVVPFPTYVNITASVTPGLPDNGKIYLADTTSANITILLPNSTLVAVPLGYVLEGIKVDGTTNTLSVQTQGSDVVKGLGSNAIAYPQQSGKVTYVGGHIWRFTPTSRLGAVDACLGTIAPPGAVLLDGNTIGNAGSGATHASADCEGAYHYLWRNFANGQCPVTGGRGASAQADWNANKAIQVPDARGRAIHGYDAGGAAGRLTAATVDSSVMGNNGGEEKHTLITGEIPVHNHTASATDSGHTHLLAQSGTTNRQLQLAGDVMLTRYSQSSSPDDFIPGLASGTPAVGTSGVGNANIAVTVNNAGNGQSHNNVDPTLVLNYIMWLA